MSIQYYDPVTGCWLGSYQEGTPCRYLEAAPAPADANGFYGCEGMRWDGMAWVDDPTAADQAFALMYPEQALAQERAGMVADKWQIVAALEILEPGAWPKVATFRASPLCTPVFAAAIDYAITLPRMSESVATLAWAMDLPDERVDAVFRLAMMIRG